MAATYGGATKASANGTTISCPLPSGVEAGDKLVAVHYANMTSGFPAAPAGWVTEINETFSSSFHGQIYSRDYTPGAPGVTITAANISKRVLIIAAVHNPDGLMDIVADIASGAGSTTKPAPDITLPDPGVVLTFWGERSSTPTTAVTAPAETTLDAAEYTTLSGAVSGAVAYTDELSAGLFEPGDWEINGPGANAAIRWSVSVKSGSEIPPVVPIETPVNLVHVASAVTAHANTLTPSITIPALAQQGDLAVMCCVYTQTGTPADPDLSDEGWTLWDTLEVTISMRTQLWYRILSAGDPGDTLSQTWSGLQKATFGMEVYRNHNGIDGATVTALPAGSTSNPSPPLTTTENGKLLSFMVDRGGTAATGFTPPTGFTELQEHIGSLGGQTSLGSAEQPDGFEPFPWAPDPWVSTSANRAAVWTVGIADGPIYELPGPHIARWDGTALIEVGLARVVSSTELAPVTLLRTFTPILDLVSAMPAFSIVAHRGGANENPQNTMLAFHHAATIVGIAGLECDLHTNADDTLVMSHDPSVDSWTDSTGTVISKTDAQWNTIQANAIAGDGPTPVGYWSQLADAYGGIHVLAPEAKSATSIVPLINDVLARNLQRATVVQSFTYARVQAAVQAGIYGLFLTNAPNFTTLVADGVQFIGVEMASVTEAMCDNAHAAGIKVWAYTVNNTTNRDAMLALGVDGVFTNNPTNLLAP